MRSRLICAIAGATMTLLASQATAQQQSENQVAAKTDWSVFEETEPRECWAVSTFKESINTRDGHVVAVSRTSTLFMVFFRPDAGLNRQVAYTGGYPFAKGSTVNVNVDGNEFEMFVDGEWAWTASESDDSKIITAMKRGSKAILTAKSQRGTTTKDTFSLLGFTAALDEADKRCAK